MSNKSFSFVPNRILCPVDLSALSDLALKYAAVGARGFGATLTVFHAERFELPPYFTSSQLEALTREVKTERRQAQAYLQQHTRKVLGRLADDLELKFLIAEVHPVDAILEAAKAQQAELIVLGTHGRGGAKRLWLGSVAENVVRHAEVPVFVVRQKQHEFIDPGRPDQRPALNSILCPVNFSLVSRASIQIAASIAQHFDARLMPLCIIEPGEKHTLAQAQTKLESWLNQITTAPCTLELLSRKGRAAEEIVALAQIRKADLIVLGAQHSMSPRTWLLGSTTDLVLREAPAPVLVVPLAAAEKRAKRNAQ